MLRHPVGTSRRPCDTRAHRLAAVCTVVIDVDGSGRSRLLAVRDEDPAREWDPLGEWWPEKYPGVIGVRDRRAGGAWIAADPNSRRLAVLLNRADVLDLPDDQAQSRGILTLESVMGRSPEGSPMMHGFNLLEAGPEGARVLSWDGEQLRETPVPLGVHMVAHDDLDDPATARITRWLPAFRALPEQSADWAQEWTDLLASTTTLEPTDDAAIIRDNRPHGYPTQSLLYCLAEIDPVGIDLRETELDTPGHWN